MRRLRIGVLLIPLLAAPGIAMPQEPDRATIELGIKVYARERCRTCHSIAGDGNRRSPLDGVGSRLTEEEIRTWIVAPQQMDPKVRKRPYKLPENELKAIVAYLASLKAKDKD
jgi:cytochrome c2